MGLNVIKEISLNKKKVSEKNVHALTATLQGITSSYCFYFILGIFLAYSLGQALVSQC